MSDDEELTADSEEYRQEVCRRLAAEVVARLTEPLPLETVQRLMYTRLRTELFDYDQRRSRRELTEFQDDVIRKVGGGVPRFGESLSALAEGGRAYRRVNNAATFVAQELYTDLSEMLQTSPDEWDITAPIQRVTDRVVRLNRLRHDTFWWTSVLGSLGICAAFVLGWLNLIASLATIGVLIASAWTGTRFFDVHDHD